MVPDSNHATPRLMVINCGRSSLKFAVFPLVGETAWFKGLAERLHSPEATLTIKREEMSEVIAIPCATHHTALEETVSRLSGLTPCGFGHRIVLGGEHFTHSVQINDAVVSAICRCSSLAPLHNPANLIGIQVSRELFPDLPRVTVFDTAFHQTLPPKAFLHVIPNRITLTSSCGVTDSTAPVIIPSYP